MVGKKHGFDIFTPIKDFTDQQVHVLLYGDREPLNGQWSNGASMWMRDGWEGVIPQTCGFIAKQRVNGEKKT